MKWSTFTPSTPSHVDVFVHVCGLVCVLTSMTFGKSLKDFDRLPTAVNRKHKYTYPQQQLQCENIHVHTKELHQRKLSRFTCRYWHSGHMLSSWDRNPHVSSVIAMICDGRLEVIWSFSHPHTPLTTPHTHPYTPHTPLTHLQHHNPPPNRSMKTITWAKRMPKSVHCSLSTIPSHHMPLTHLQVYPVCTHDWQHYMYTTSGGLSTLLSSHSGGVRHHTWMYDTMLDALVVYVNISRAYSTPSTHLHYNDNQFLLYVRQRVISQ